MNQISNLNSYPVEISNVESSTSIENNDLQKQREKVYEFIQVNYEIFISNVDHLDEAQVICLGERHDNEMHRKINAQIIDMLYVDESILLVEETRQETHENSNVLTEDELTNSQAKYIKKPIKIEGWDIEEGENRLKELKEYVKACHIYKKPEITHFLSLSKMKKTTNDLKNNQQSTCRLLKVMFSCFCTVCCTALFIKSCNPCIKKYYKNEVHKGLQKIINEVPIRNQHMCESIQKVLETHKKIFVIGGQKHFDFVEQGEGVEGIDYSLSNKAVEQTMHFLATKKCAILIPKSGEEVYFETFI